jgi:membrane complex biogenesis BtpA family protein
MLIQNRWDRASARAASSPETVAAMALVTQEIVAGVPVPVGVHILRNDFNGSLAVAKVCGAAFVRATCVVGATYLAHGILEAHPEEYVRYQQRIGATDVRILADIWSMHYKPLVPTPVEEIARQASAMGLADAVVVAVTDADEMFGIVKTIKTAHPNLPVILGGYTNKENIARLLTVADGAIVGRTFERDAGKQQGEVLPQRVRDFMKVARG